mmetsp:Transcript_33820/g.81379  ORF Transcript_33820/g.81379 Transcript_33820/m.81379 type:complete len:85 (-) Transcript_33820:473-727(-)
MVSLLVFDAYFISFVLVATSSSSSVNNDNKKASISFEMVDMMKLQPFTGSFQNGKFPLFSLLTSFLQNENLRILVREECNPAQV